MLLDKLHHAVQKLASPSAVLRAIVLKENKRVDPGKPGLVFEPQVLEPVHDAVAGDLGRANRDGQLVMLGEQEAHGRGRAGREIVVERLNRHATLAVTRELAD